MPRKSEKASNVCPKCGTEVKEPAKTWQLVSPLPDAEGRITITVMALFVCPNCGFKWRAALSKMKVGSEGIEIEGAKKGAVKMVKEERKSERRENVIELDLSEIMEEE
jgi:DNA-directed RNA polymerase subunit RPC12/RpoP